MKKVILASIMILALSAPAIATNYDGFTDNNRGWDDIKTGSNSIYSGSENTSDIYTQDELAKLDTTSQTNFLAGGVSMAQTKAKNNEQAIKKESEDRIEADSQQDSRISANSQTINTFQTDIEENKSSIAELYNAAGDRTEKNSKRITENTKRISKIEFQVQDLYREVKRLDGAIAASTAVGSMVTPKYEGDTVISVGMGHYNGSSALAFGATHNLTENVAFRATVAGSDADNWSKPVMGASANWAF